MTNGMKSGAGSDPFADDDDEEEGTETANANNQGESTPTNQEAETGGERSASVEKSEASNSTSDTGEEDLPYLFQRRGVKDDRTMVQYFLREETEALETDVKRAVEQELGTEVYLTDIREALIRVGAEHSDEVADELRDWGYRHREK